MKRYLWQDRHGRWRVRKGGKTYPLRDEAGVWHEVDTPEGDRLYWEILRGKRAEPKRSWGAAFKLLMETEWDELAPRYRQDLAPVIAYLTDKIGKRHVAQLKPSDIYAAMDANKHRVRFANYLPVAISKAANVAIKRGWLTVNPALRIERLKTPKAKERPHTPWTDVAVAKFRAEAGPLPRLIFELGIGSVQRPGDLVGFTWGDYDGEALHLVQNKTWRALVIPCTAQLKAALDAELSRLPFTPMPSRRILTLQDGKPMSYRRLAEIMRAERGRLGLLEYDLHAMRYRGVMELAWAGCADDEISSYSGHATIAMVRKYAGKARQIMLAKSAKRKRDGG